MVWIFVNMEFVWWVVLSCLSVIVNEVILENFVIRKWIFVYWICVSKVYVYIDIFFGLFVDVNWDI